MKLILRKLQRNKEKFYRINFIFSENNRSFFIWISSEAKKVANTITVEGEIRADLL
jgi:hypothetical protein